MGKSKNNKTNTNGGIRLQKRIYKPSKYHRIIDPVLATYPMGIELDEDKCIGCGICIQQCAAQTLGMVKREKPSDLQLPACQYTCPAGIPVRDYMKLIAGGASLDKAWNVLTKNNPLPAVTGRVCPHPCETACNRGYLDKPVNINCVERAVGDYGIAKGLGFQKPSKTNGIKVAVIGSGPSGLSCAYQLAMMGYNVTVFEASAKPGGMLTYAIPQYRLPEEVVEKEIQRIIDLGVILELNTSIGKDISLDALKKEFKAIYIAIGAQSGKKLGLDGEEVGGVINGVDFLRRVNMKENLNLNGPTIVIGGGNVAMDVARTAQRIGASKVSLFCLETREEMPAHHEEIEDALLEGIEVCNSWGPKRILQENGQVLAVEFQICLTVFNENGEFAPTFDNKTTTVKASNVLIAIGQAMDWGLLPVGSKFELNPDGTLKVQEQSLQTSDPSVFAGGDAVSGPGLVTQAIGAGRKAALGIDAFIKGQKVDAPEKFEISYKNVPNMEKLHHLYEYKKISRVEAAKLDLVKRQTNPNVEVGLTLTEDQTVNESRRCIQCGTYKVAFVGLRTTDFFGSVCLGCNTCSAICPQQALLENKSYRIDEGRWATLNDAPVEIRDGLPNPLRLPRPVPFKEIVSEITETERSIYTRRSCRVYKPDPVPKELIERILEAGRFAPTAGNCQGYKFVVVTDRALLNKISDATWKYVSIVPKVAITRNTVGRTVKKLMNLILPNAMDQRPAVAITGMTNPQFGDKGLDAFFDAPCVIMVVPNELHVSDVVFGMGIVCQNIVLAAESLGLGTCYVGFFANAIKAKKVPKEVFERLGLEWPYEIPTMGICLGYQAVPMHRAVPRDFPNIRWVE